MIRKLSIFFSLLENGEPVSVNEDLFGFYEKAPCSLPQYEQDDIDLITAFYSGTLKPSALPEPVYTLFELSINAFEIFIHAWMSEIPIEREISAFAGKVITAAQTVNDPEEKRVMAERAVFDRGDANTLTSLNISAKVQREIHRMTELLRFIPDANGVFIAKCGPDHLVLPALGVYFTARFGETPWAIIDEKRGLCLHCKQGEQARILITKDISAVYRTEDNDDWEVLWKHYHRIINNENRDNPNLQCQLMPKRYWKYLPEKT